MEKVSGKRHDEHVGADNTSHENRMRDAQRSHDRLFFEISKAILQVRINRERKPRLGNFGNLARLKRDHSCFCRFGNFARVLCQMLAKKNVSTAHLKQAPCRNEIRTSVDSQNPCDPCASIDESDERAREQHSSLHADDNRRVCARVLALWNHFLHKRIHVGPVHCGTDAGNQCNGVEMPKLEVATPGDVSSTNHGEAADKIKNDAEIATIE